MNLKMNQQPVPGMALPALSTSSPSVPAGVIPTPNAPPDPPNSIGLQPGLYAGEADIKKAEK
jgi:hypothetical protein